MSIEIDFSYQIDGFYDSVNYYRSETPMNPESMPVATATGIIGTTYTDTTALDDRPYYVRFGSIRNGIEKISNEIQITGDQYWSNVVALLHFESGITDQKGRTWSSVGSPTTSATGGKFSGQLILNGSSGLTTNATGFDFGTGDFTIEMFVKQSSPNNQWRELFMANSSGGINSMLYDRKIAIGRELIATDYIASSEVIQNEFKHIAFSRNSGVVRGFVDGIKQFEGGWNYSFSSNALHSLGSKSNGTSGFVGSISEVRITKGVGRYAANFTPPSSKFPNF